MAKQPQRDNPPTKEEQQRAREAAKKILISHGMSEQDIDTYFNSANNVSTDPSVLATIAKTYATNKGYSPEVLNAVSEIKNYADNARLSTDPNRRAEWEGYYREAINKAPDGVSEYIAGKGLSYDPNDASTSWIRDYQDRFNAPSIEQQALNTNPNPAPTPTVQPTSQPIQNPAPTPTQTATTVATPTATPTTAKAQNQQPAKQAQAQPRTQAEAVQAQAAIEAQAPLQPQPPTYPWRTGVAFGSPVPTPPSGQVDVAVDPANTIGPSVVPASTVPTSSPTPVYMDWYQNNVDAENERNQKELEELKRRSRAREAIGGISDASSALANLIFTGETYAPDMYDPKNSMSEKAYERYLRARKELDKTHTDNLAYIERLQKQRNADRTADIQNRRLDYLIKQEADRTKAKELEYELENAKFEWKKKMEEGKMTLDQAKYELDKLVRLGKLDIDRAGLIKHELEDYDKEITIHRDLSGKEIGRTETRRVKHKDGSTTTTTSSSDGSNTPPSMRNKSGESNDNNKPPSRRNN